MDSKILIAIFLVLAIPSTFANIAISPQTLNLELRGGEHITQTYIIKNNSSVIADINLTLIISNPSGDLTGFNYTISETTFSLASNEEKNIKVTFSANQAILPEHYSATLEAHSKIDTPNPRPPIQPPANTTYSNSGSTPLKPKPQPQKPTEPIEQIDAETEPTEPIEQKTQTLPPIGLFELIPANIYITSFLITLALATLLILQFGKNKKNKKGGNKQ